MQLIVIVLEHIHLYHEGLKRRFWLLYLINKEPMRYLVLAKRAKLAIYIPVTSGAPSQTTISAFSPSKCFTIVSAVDTYNAD